MTYHNLLRIGAAAAIFGGALRVIASFIVYRENSVGLEAFYFVIDICLLIGLFAIYLHIAEHLGWYGVASFGVAMSGLASIVGPDTNFSGLDLYQIGAAVFLFGLSGLAAVMLWVKIIKLAALYWMAALAVGIVSTLSGSAFVFAIAGMLMALGFVSAGVTTLLVLEEVKTKV